MTILSLSSHPLEQRDIPLLRRGGPLSETKGRGGFSGEERGKRKEERKKTNYRSIISPSPKNYEIFPSSGGVALCRRRRVG